MILVGVRSYQTLVAIVSFICRHCGVHGPKRIEKIVTKFTLFLVPLFPLSTKYLATCVACGTSTPVESQLGARVEAEQAASPDTSTPGPGSTQWQQPPPSGR